MTMTPRRGFTLVELLVVVSIITVLVAMLVPAMAKAVYQAQLTQCGANQNAAGVTFNIYAASHNRRYPYRQNIGQYAMATTQLTGAGVNVSWTNTLKGFVSLNNTFNCPLTQRIDVEKSLGQSGIFTPYSYFAGAHFSQKNTNHQKGMNKMGDRFEWHLNERDEAYADGPKKYDVIFGDYVYAAILGTSGESSHPDKDARWAPRFAQDDPNRHEATAPHYAQNTITETHWYGDSKRGKIDLNFTRTDGSVQRLDDIIFKYDDRMEQIPHLWDNQYKWRIWVPVR